MGSFTLELKGVAVTPKMNVSLKALNNLRKELTEMGKIQTRKQWDEIQVKFLNQHQYFTSTAINSRQQKKQENLFEVVARLEANDYPEEL